jgi:hypothetical protein
MNQPKLYTVAKMAWNLLVQLLTRPPHSCCPVDCLSSNMVMLKEKMAK